MKKSCTLMKLFAAREIFTLLFFLGSVHFTYSQNQLPVSGTAYTIKIPARTVLGIFEPARELNIDYTSSDNYLKNTIHVKFKNSLSDNNINSVAGNLSLYFNLIGVKEFHTLIDQPIVKAIAGMDYYGIGRIYEITYSADIDPYKICMDLMNDPNVVYASPVFMRYPDTFTPNDPSYGSQYALPLIKANLAWDITKGDSNVVIAICDVGTDWRHTDLKANIWINPGEIPNNGIDDDKNGKIDDVNGWDFIGNATSYGSWKEDNDPGNIAQTHGTHVAGIASAVTNNGKGVASIGYRCKILPIKLGSDNSYISGVFRGYDGILYAAGMGARIINCSWGGINPSPSEQDVINQATAMGSLVVAASGNYASNSDESPHYPGSYDKVLNVGSSNSADQIAPTSNYGFTVHVFAPGEGILSTFPNNSYATISGTSMASPLVAGLAGLVAGLHKDWTPFQIKQQIRGTCDRFPGNPGNLRQYYFGRINAYKAVMFNNDSFPGKTIPGIYSTSFSLGTGTAITDYNPVPVHVNLSNCLSDADTVDIALSSLDKGVSFDDTTFRIIPFHHGDTNTISFNLSLLNNFAWANGKVEVLLTITSKDYFNLEKVLIPVQLPTTNQFSTISTFNSMLSPVWNGVSAPSKNLVWGIGNSGVYSYGMYFRYSGSVSSSFMAYNSGYVTDPLYCIGAANSLKAMAGTSKNYVYRTSNGGGSWTRIDISGITTFVNAIHFFDENNAIIIGDPYNGNWGIGNSTNGGLNIYKVNNVPPPVTSEAGTVESACFNGPDVWFGTTKGRLYFSPDSGRTWTVDTVHLGGQVLRISFINRHKGIVAYRETASTTGDIYLASTTDDGKTWNKRILNLTENNFQPLTFAGLPLSDIILTRYSKGDIYKTEDMGLHTSPVLSTKSITYQTGCAYTENGLAQLWAAGSALTKFEYHYTIDSTLSVPGFQPESSLNLYPNPVVSDLNISISCKNNDKPVEIRILDLSGRTIDVVPVDRKPGNTGSVLYDAATLTNGIYIITVRFSSGKITHGMFQKL